MNVVKSSKQKLAVLLTLVMLLSMIPMMALADNHEIIGVAFRIDVMGYWVDGEWVETDVVPYIQDSRTMVPVAHAARAIEAKVTWNADTQMVTVTKDETVVTMTIGNNLMMMDEEVITMDTEPVIKDLGNGLGRTMLPVSWLAKALDVPYNWDAETNTATFKPVIEEVVEEVVEPLMFNEAGTYGPASVSVTINNNVLIMAEGVVLQNYIIKGDLIIAEDVEEGEVTLKNVTVEGELIVRGGGEDSIYINGGNIKTVRIEATSSNAVRIVVIDVEGMDIIISELASDKKIILEGNFDKITIEAKGVVVETRGETTIKEMVVAEQSEGVTVTLSADTTIEKAVVNTDRVSINGEGTVELKEGDGKVTYSENVTQPAPPRTGGGGGGGGGGIITTTKTNLYISVDRLGTSKTVTATILEPGVAINTPAVFVVMYDSLVDAMGKIPTEIIIGEEIIVVDTNAKLTTMNAIVTAFASEFDADLLGDLKGETFYMHDGAIIYKVNVAE